MKIFLFLLLATISASAAEPFTVNVVVSGDATNEISSYLCRELRDLKDVEVVDSGDTTISVVSIETVNQSGLKTGYALSFIILDHFTTNNAALINYALGVPLTTTNIQTVAHFTDNLVTVEDHELICVPDEELKSACEKFVARFDTQNLEPDRQIISKFNSILSQATNSISTNTAAKP